jgi:hypothetical protein
LTCPPAIKRLPVFGSDNEGFPQHSGQKFIHAKACVCVAVESIRT